MRGNVKELRLYFPQGEVSLIQNELYSNEHFRKREQIDSDFPYLHPGHCIFQIHFHTVLQRASCRAEVIVMHSVYSEICVCSDTFRRLRSSHMLLVLIEHLFYNSQKDAAASLRLMFIVLTSPQLWKFSLDFSLEALLRD